MLLHRTWAWIGCELSESFFFINAASRPPLFVLFGSAIVTHHLRLLLPRCQQSPRPVASLKSAVIAAFAVVNLASAYTPNKPSTKARYPFAQPYSQSFLDGTLRDHGTASSATSPTSADMSKDTRCLNTLAARVRTPTARPTWHWARSSGRLHSRSGHRVEASWRALARPRPGFQVFHVACQDL